MTKIDKIIIRVFYVSITAILLYFLFAYPSEFSIVLSTILALMYYIFVASHLFILMPLFFIIMRLEDVIKEYKITENIKSQSSIIGFAANILIQVSFLSIVYFFTPVGIAMLYNGSFELSLALDRIVLVLQ